MITTRTARQCGQADYGWLQARYTFSFGHYFDPKLLGYASLRVLNQEVLAPGAAFQPRTYPKVDILNVILDGEAEYRDSEGNHVQASAGEVLPALTCGDGAFIRDEANITLVADSPLRALLIDLPV
ncbi:pirin family protein [Escherichia coli]|uniref:pirin family protein n=1 Tax=Escherichia coli TaxID=562 RepID=UPI000FDB16C8|nr:pirin family protein [Escherichia coli]RVR22354.1 pirin family protein [Escherichia coli]